jgi:hypothetical protein
MTLTWNGTEPHRERWIIVATAAFVLLSVVVLHRVGAYNRAHPESLFDGARRGAMLQVTLNDSICSELHLGELVCGRNYLARYNKRTDKWTLRGPTIYVPTNDTTTATFPNLDNHPGRISVWGLPALFDSEGTLTVDRHKIGTVQFAVGNWKPMPDQP